MPSKLNLPVSRFPDAGKTIDLSRLSGNFIFRALMPPIEKLLAIDKFNLACTCMNKASEGADFFSASLEALQVKYRLKPYDQAKISASGPLLIVANHPYGGLDGIILGHILSKVRPDFRIMANGLLGGVADLRPWLIRVDPFKNQDKFPQNAAGILSALRWLKNVHALITFPAGEVSHLNMKHKGITDPEWSRHTGAIARMTGSAVLPVYFSGRNSLQFQMAGLVHPRLRTALLPRELMNKSRKIAEVAVGSPIPFARFGSMENDTRITAFFRSRVYLLRNRSGGKKPGMESGASRFGARYKDVVPAIDKETLRGEIFSLPQNQCFEENREFKVVLASAAQIPAVLHEIGRLRELTFRAVGEGTGKSADLDEFDRSYLHLFLWHKDQEAVAGAYRLGLCDDLIKKSGLSGLYTSTLFRFHPFLAGKLSNALEMGRSFIAPEFQKKHSCLNLLWKGIGEFVVRNPRYHVLFGPVSISRDYHPLSRDLMISWLLNNQREPELGRLVEARRPYRLGKALRRFDGGPSPVEYNLEDINSMVSELEENGKGIPILLKQYLKLSGRLIDFNIDKQFSDVVDGLILVDLVKTDPRLLKRFMGDDGHRFFERHHRLCARPAEGSLAG